MTQLYSLGTLLLDAGVITGEQLDRGVQRSQSTGLPLGRILVLGGVLSESSLGLALEVLVRARDDAMISLADVIEALQLVAAREKRILTKDGENRLHAFLSAGTHSKVRIGELLVRAGRMGEMDVINALEISLRDGCLIGHVFLELRYLPPEQLEEALELQQEVEQGELDIASAVRALTPEWFLP